MRQIDGDELEAIYKDRLRKIAQRYGPDSSEAGIMSGVLKLLKAQSTIEPEQRWTPCSEGMPKKFGEMLVTTVPPAGMLWARVMIAHYSDLMGISKPCFWIGEVGKHSFKNITNRVTAWMPLPKPYKKR